MNKPKLIAILSAIGLLAAAGFARSADRTDSKGRQSGPGDQVETVFQQEAGTWDVIIHTWPNGNFDRPKRSGRYSTTSLGPTA